jgi:hypothetical protein
MRGCIMERRKSCALNKFIKYNKDYYSGIELLLWLSSVVILLQPDPVSHRIIQGKVCVLSSSVLSSYGLPLPPTCLLLTVNEARSYFSSTIILPVSEEISFRRGLVFFPSTFVAGVCFWSRDWLPFFTCSGDFKCVARFIFFDVSLTGSNKKKVKQSRYTPWRRLGGEEV